MTSMQFPGSYISFASRGLGRCSSVGGFGWNSGWWNQNVAGFSAWGGCFAALGFPLDADLPMNS